MICPRPDCPMIRSPNISPARLIMSRASPAVRRRAVPGSALAGFLVVAACLGSDAGGGGADPAGLVTVIDSTADSVYALVDGAVPPAAVRRLVEELQIAPAADDTSLFTEVRGFAVDQAGRLWVFDQPTRSILLFGADGVLIRRIGREGGGPGEFRHNGGMLALPDTGVALWDGQNARISFFDAAGELQGSWPTRGGFTTSNALFADTSGTFYLRRPVTPPRAGEILGRMGLVRLNPEDGSFRDSLLPTDLEVQREAYVAQRREGRENVSTSSTGSRYQPNYLWAWHPDGYFVVAHGGRYEIIISPPAAKPIVIRRDPPRVPVPAEEIEEERAFITWSMRQTDPGWSFSGPALPETKAPLSSIAVTRDGRIWARVATPSERIPEAERVPSRDPERPVITFRSPVAYEVFAPDGRFLGRVDFPPRTVLVEADGDTVWGLGRDADGLPAVLRLRIEPGLR